MTKVTFKRVKGGHFTQVIIEGHANFADLGKDIVCSACSILAFTLIDTIDKLTKHYEILEVHAPEKGKMVIKIHTLKEDTTLNDKMLFTLIDTVFMTTANGYELLAKEYPNHVLVKYDIIK